MSWSIQAPQVFKHARTHAHPENPFIEVGGAHLKKTMSPMLVLNIVLDTDYKVYKKN